MKNELLDRELDPTPLVNAIIEKTRAGKLKWEATALPNTFIASVGGNTTLKIYLEPTLRLDAIGKANEIPLPTLSLLDEKGKTLWEISSREVKGDLWALFRLAQRIGNRLDERMENLMEVVQKL